MPPAGKFIDHGLLELVARLALTVPVSVLTKSGLLPLVPDAVTYCVAITVDAGLVFCSDSRTNARIGEKPQLMMVYPQGNHITTCKDTPYKWTPCSNLTLGPPLELMAYHMDNFMLSSNRFDEDDEYLRELKLFLDARIAAAFLQLPPVDWPQ